MVVLIFESKKLPFQQLINYLHLAKNGIEKDRKSYD